MLPSSHFNPYINILDVESAIIREVPEFDGSRKGSTLSDGYHEIYNPDLARNNPFDAICLLLYMAFLHKKEMETNWKKTNYLKVLLAVTIIICSQYSSLLAQVKLTGVNWNTTYIPESRYIGPAGTGRSLSRATESRFHADSTDHTFLPNHHAILFNPFATERTVFKKQSGLDISMVIFHPAFFLQIANDSCPIVDNITDNIITKNIGI